MTSVSDRSSRWAPLSGIAFVILFVVGVLLTHTPAPNASDAKWVDYFGDGGHRAAIIVAAFLFVLAGLCLLSFLTTIWSRVAAAQHPDPLNPLPLVAAAVAGTSIAIGGVINAAIAGAITFGDLPVPSADILRVSDQLAFPVVAIAGMFATSLAIACLSLQARRVGIFGRGLTTFSLIAAAITLASFLFLPLLVMLLWFLVVAIALLRRGSPA